MKRFLVIIAIFMTAFIFCSCSASDKIIKKQVAVISEQGEILDKNYNQLVWEGVCLHADKAEISFLASHDETSYSANLSSLADKKIDLIWSTDGSSPEVLEAFAVVNPDIMFACANGAFKNPLSNLVGVSFRGNEGAFLAGYVAARTSKTKKIGFVGGMGDENTLEFEHGFVQGAKYVDPKTEVFSDYAQSYSDKALGASIARSQYDRGADVIFHAAGTTGLGVIEQAKIMGKYVIGVDVDQSSLAPENVLMSVVKQANSVVGDITGRFLEGEAVGGMNFEYGLADGGIDIVPNSSLIDGQIYSEALNLKYAIVTGSIEVFK